MTEPKPWLRELEIEIDPDHVKHKLDEVLDQLVQEAEFPGFRKGHAPKELLRRRLGSELENQTARELVRDAYEQAIVEKNLRPIKPAGLDDFELTPEKAIRFRLSLEVLPDFELQEYTGIPVNQTNPTGFDAEFERRLNQMREQLAAYTPLSRPAQNGDYLLADYVATDDQGKATRREATRREATRPEVIDRKSNVMFRVGDSENFPELNEQFLGMKPGDEKDVAVTIPEDYENRKFAGKTLAYHFGVRSIKEKKLPEVDEEFASHLGFDGLDALRVWLNQQILADREKDVEADRLHQISEHLVRTHTVEPPPSLVEEVYRDLLARTKLPENDETKTRLDEIARKKARFQLVIARIAEKENIEVNDEEQDQILADYATESGTDPAEVEVLKTRPGFRYRLLEDKVMKFLLAKAHVQ
jgi:trigger factor